MQMLMCTHKHTRKANLSYFLFLLLPSPGMLAHTTKTRFANIHLPKVKVMQVSRLQMGKRKDECFYVLRRARMCCGL